MKYYIENRGANDYFCINLEQEDIIDELTLGMITHNTIPCFAPAVYTQMNDERVVRYDISDKVSLTKILESVMNKRKILTIFSEIISAINNCSDYLLEKESLLLDKKRVFVNPHNLNIYLICSPIEIKKESDKLPNTDDDSFDSDGEESKTDSKIKSFFMDILLSTRFDKNESGVYLKYLVNYLGGDIKFKIGRFSSLINDIKEGNPIAPKDYGFDDGDDADLGIMTESFQGDSFTLGAGSRWTRATSGKEMEIPVKKDEVSSDTESKNQENPEKKKGFAALFGSKEKIGKSLGLEELVETISGSGKSKNEKKGLLSGLLGSSNQSKPKQNKSVGFEIPGEQFIPSISQRKNTDRPKEEQIEKKDIRHSAWDKEPAEKSDRGYKNFGGTVFMGSSKTSTDEEIVEGTDEVPYITRCKDGLSYPIMKEEYIIGRNKEEVDCFIDNATIGRTHAKIVCRKGVCEIFDLGSVNKTFVNGFRVAGNKSIRLQPGDKIRLSNEEFDFDYK
ncbi:MAG: FHA domain-containing protein [Clostridia bacterium]|nr:FHA domain-containing protein [Clostridia bacterium]